MRAPRTEIMALDEDSDNEDEGADVFDMVCIVTDDRGLGVDGGQTELHCASPNQSLNTHMGVGCLLLKMS